MPPPIHDDQIFWLVLVEQLEFAWGTDHNPVAWDAKAWVGGDYNRLWLKSEGGRSTNRRGGEFEIQALYGRLISPFWEVQAGVRFDRQIDVPDAQDRAHLALGFEGIAPYWIEFEPTLYVSSEGDVSARFEAKYDLLLTQRLMVQPELEVNLSANTVEQWGIGKGLVDMSAALRLSYEIRRELAPYVGVEWAQRFGESADFARENDELVAEWSALFGVRFWF